MKSLSIIKSKQEVLNSLQSLFLEYKEKRKKIEEISDYVKNKSEVLPYFLSGNKANHLYANSIFEKKGALSSLNAEYWSTVMQMTDVLSCMTAQKRNEWHNMIHELKTPDFDESTVISTVYNLLQNRDQFFADKVDGIFQKLSKNHVTNSPMGFKQRLIIESLIGSFNLINHDRLEYIQDLRSVIAKIMKRDDPDSRLYTEISQMIKDTGYGVWNSFDGGAFSIRVYKKGTAHIEIDEDMAIELNSILAQKYPMAIPEKNRQKSKVKSKKKFHLDMKILSFDACQYLSDISQKVEKGNSFFLNYHDISEMVKSEILEVLEYLQVVESEDLYSFNYDASAVLREISRSGTLPDKKSHQFYPTGEYLSKKMTRSLNIESWEKVLEPSAGLGGIAGFLPRRQTTCVEISPIHCSHLKSMGFNEVVESDFLEYFPNKLFDKIVMNPPFTKNQAKDHLLHAISLLSENGVLKAILPSSYSGKKFCEKRFHGYSKIIEGEFEGTNVSVVILTLSFNEDDVEILE